ncbi:Tigger transposable element-derived protein 6 [Dictyocoela roeselum]|nr:Tigger transposable element-derived protein 6 [Dictyocoela roeselum]
MQHLHDKKTHVKKNKIDEVEIFLCKKKTYEFEKLGHLLFEVFIKLRDSYIPLNGPILKSIALKISNKIGLRNFKASNGWLENFRKRNELSFKHISDESNSSDTSNIENFRHKFNQKFIEYGTVNIFNCDETALFYKNPPKKSLVRPDDDCKGIKSNKTRVTIMLTCIFAG